MQIWRIEQDVDQSRDVKWGAVDPDLTVYFPVRTDPSEWVQDSAHIFSIANDLEKFEVSSYG